MKKMYVIIMILCSSELLIAQSWTKISSNLDSLWTSSVKYFNKGDTIVYYGSKTGTGAFNAKQFYVSTDGGLNFTRDFTKLDAIGYQAFYALPKNNTLMGFKNSPNVGSYNFAGINNWGTVLAFYYGLWAEVNTGNLLLQNFGSTNLYSVSYPSGTITANISFNHELICTYNVGNRLFLGGKKNNIIKFVDNGNFASIQTATIQDLGLGASVLRFFESGSKLYAVVFDGQDKLFKSSDNGASWTLQTTNYFKNSIQQQYLVSTFTLGTPNGNIFFLTNAGNSDDVYLSTDGGATANKIGSGLPANGIKIGPTIGKILTSGNKVWYQVCGARTTDYVSTDTSIAGLYRFNGNTTSLSKNFMVDEKITIFSNQTKTKLFVNSPVEIKSYRIISIDGKQMAASAFNKQDIDISDLVDGAYIIKLTTSENKSFTSKFILN